MSGSPAVPGYFRVSLSPKQDWLMPHIQLFLHKFGLLHCHLGAAAEVEVYNIANDRMFGMQKVHAWALKHGNQACSLLARALLTVLGMMYGRSCGVTNHNGFSNTWILAPTVSEVLKHLFRCSGVSTAVVYCLSFVAVT